MDEKKINESLQHAIQSMVPDCCEEILKMPVEKQQRQDRFTKQPGRNTVKIKQLAAVAAGFMICFLAGLLWYQGEQNYAMVTIDVNPGITLTVNHKNQVVKATAANEEGKKIIEQTEPLKKNISQAAEEIMKELYSKNYLKENQENYLLLSAQKNKGLLENIKKSVEKLPVSCEIIYQTFKKNRQVKKTAETYGITLGKAELVERIFTKASGQYDRPQLSSSSIQELAVFAQETGVLEEEDINLMHFRQKHLKDTGQQNQKQQDIETHQQPPARENVPPAAPAGNLKEVWLPDEKENKEAEEESREKAQEDEKEDREEIEDEEKDEDRNDQTGENDGNEGEDKQEEEEVEEPEEDSQEPKEEEEEEELEEEESQDPEEESGEAEDSEEPDTESEED